ncbi:MAG: DUF58 domain-containing protein [Gemmatimonadaceae bacterium]
MTQRTRRAEGRAAERRAEGDEPQYGALLDAVRGLRWHARRAARIAVPGIHPSRVRGTSAEFTEYRAYRQGDDLRRVDWKLFARSDRAHVRISEERAVTPTMIVLDASASMAFPDGSSSKWTLARQLAVALAAIAHAGGDPVGLAVAGAESRTLLPRTRRGVVAEMIRVVDDISANGTAPLAPCVSAAARAAVRVAIVTDFLGDGEGLLRSAREMTVAGRDVYGIHVIAQAELDPPQSTSVVMDPEDAAVRRAMTDATRTEYLRAFAAWRAATADSWLASGAAYRVVVAGQEPASHAARRIVRDEPALAGAV